MSSRAIKNEQTPGEGQGPKVIVAANDSAGGSLNIIAANKYTGEDSKDSAR